MSTCLICDGNQLKLIWNSKIRNGAKTFTKKNEKIYQCKNCELIFLKNKRRLLENSSITRNKYNKNNSIKEFKKFHTPREIKKLEFIKKYINFKNKEILESNCGSGIILDKLFKSAKHTFGLDNKFYKKHFDNKEHTFYSHIDSIIKNKKKFDIILSLSEIEHKHNPIIFLNKIKKLMKKNSKLALRIPNYNNIYYYLLNKKFLKYDFRTSHNFYFSEKNLDILFKKLKFKILVKKGFNEYSLNHLFTFIKKGRRIKSHEVKNVYSNQKTREVIKNIEDTMSSTSLIYILKI